MNRRLFGIFALACLSFGSFCQAEKSDELSKVRLKTNKGDIVIELDADKAPVTVANFKKYVEAGHYNGTVFHRVIADFMIQGGGFASEGGKLVEKKTGAGIVNESQNGLKNELGTIAMARMRDPNSATAQFFINVADNKNLNFPSNGGYAVFGKVIEGMDVVKQIKVVKTGVKELVNLDPRNGELIPSPSKDVPDEPIIIESATLE
jgi:cyclophilin family peptidyl-prolyl cis-trans isomerase